MTTASTALVNSVEAAVRWRFRDVAVWRQNTGAVKYKDAGGKPRFVRYGKKGSGDLTGIGPRGVRIEIECKYGTGRPEPAQIEFAHVIRTHGGIYLVVRSVDDAIEQLDAALAEFRDPPPRPRRKAA